MQVSRGTKRSKSFARLDRLEYRLLMLVRVPRSTDKSPTSGPEWLPTTHWSVVLAAGGSESSAAEALDALCRRYWPPLYAYVRRLGRGREEAQDLTQEFFARLLERKHLQLADRDRGRFRTFLLTSLQRFLVNEWEKEKAVKRGGGRANFVSLDDRDLEEPERIEPADERTAAKAFDQRWALTVLDEALSRLRDECRAGGKEQLFEALKDFVWGDKSAASYGEIGSAVGMSEGAVKVAMHRLRARFREVLREAIAQTVSTPAEVDEELRYLITVLAS